MPKFATVELFWVQATLKMEQNSHVTVVFHPNVTAKIAASQFFEVCGVSHVHDCQHHSILDDYWSYAAR